MKTGRRQQVFRVVAIVLTVAVIDQVTKAWATSALAPGDVMALLPVMNLRLGFNRGVSFGLFPAGSHASVTLLIGATAVVTAALLAWSLATRNAREGAGLALIVGGALGNLIDRARQGAVTDFIDLHAAERHWPTFNVADVAITLGALWLAWDALRAPAPTQRNGAPS